MTSLFVWIWFVDWGCWSSSQSCHTCVGLVQSSFHDYPGLICLVRWASGIQLDHRPSYFCSSTCTLTVVLEVLTTWCSLGWPTFTLHKIWRFSLALLCRPQLQRMSQCRAAYSCSCTLGGEILQMIDTMLVFHPHHDISVQGGVYLQPIIALKQNWPVLP